jgi:hypothetical protein
MQHDTATAANMRFNILRFINLVQEEFFFFIISDHQKNIGPIRKNK